jgi:short-subunit dehydrogenase
LDIWINNAGHGLHDTVAEMDLAACREMFETNLFGAIHGMQVAVPVMSRQGGGTIINISSVAGHIPVPLGAAYSASKFAMNAIGKAARLELKDAGIHVMTVCPGYIATAFKDNVVRGHSQRRLGTPMKGISAERVARAVWRGYRKQKREVVVPGRDRIFITLYQLWPGMVEYFMAKMIK